MDKGKKDRLKWIPNAISILRGTLLSILIFVFAIKSCWLVASILAVIAFASDAVDGWLAFKLNARSEIGAKIIEPVCDFCLSAALVAGAFFSEVISWNFVLCLILVFVPIQIGANRKRRWRGWQLVAEIYYVAALIFFLGVYFYKAMGLAFVWLVIPAVPIVSWTLWKINQRKKLPTETYSRKKMLRKEEMKNGIYRTGIK